MAVLSSPLSGAKYLFLGLKLLPKPGIRIYVILPLLINIILFTLMIILGINYFDALMDSLLPTLPQWLQWLSWLIWLVFALAVIFMVFFTFSIVVNLVGSPFNGMLAAAVERTVTGSENLSAQNDQGMLAQIKSSLVNEMKKLGYFLVWTIPLLILFVIPIIQLFAPVIWAFFVSWMLAVEYLDYPMSNHGQSGADVRRVLAQDRFRSFGFGASVMFASMLPFVNFVIMPAAVAGATVFWAEHFARLDPPQNRLSS